MKKVFAIFAIASMFAVASCGNKEVTEETETIEVVEEPVIEQEIIIEEADTTVVEEVIEVVEPAQ
ncbi:hypothetical protein LV84_00431 [Algoriphagus ratkowskyi]|uniref:Uncharacterized protein n=1 Tax=Algoriphagus ratkowskyi TaxID=57028 RepID=A0A2W7TAG2_9BACT|nr:hypothetical protein [Algoriphagus ratkowskyi]PZX60162.1 hypothetical protein LV84_00431 [Algoriphagus ratkowskyi]TXD77988.1 hypothetical protein ESW18_08025 [Algoriphagus ratkowskyi]